MRGTDGEERAGAGSGARRVGGRRWDSPRRNAVALCDEVTAAVRTLPALQLHTCRWYPASLPACPSQTGHTRAWPSPWPSQPNLVGWHGLAAPSPTSSWRPPSSHLNSCTIWSEWLGSNHFLMATGVPFQKPRYTRLKPPPPIWSWTSRSSYGIWYEELQGAGARGGEGGSW